MSDAVTITLPGRPVTATLDADALPRYLLARGWDERPGGYWRTFDMGREALSLPRAVEDDEDGSVTQFALAILAESEDRHPLDVLADIQAQEQSKP